jgi:radical SAM superfamily enzyme YgiQ (UPF0313 family)
VHLVLAYPPDEFTVRPGQQVGLGLLYVAAVAEHAGHEVTIVQEGPEYLPRLQEAVGEADVLGFTATCLDLPAVIEAREHLTFSGLTVIGGPGPSTYPEFLEPYVRCGLIDAVFMGEGEATFAEFLRHVETDGVRKTYRAGQPVDIDAIPRPARHLVQRQGHGLLLDSDGQVNAGTILASRGCPYNCHFCGSSTMWGRRVRLRDPENFRRELREMIDRYGVRELRLSDDNVIAQRDYALEIFRILGKTGVPWRLSIRVKPSDPDLYEAMRDNGCREVSFGIESFDDDVLRLLNKSATAADNQAAIRNARAAGLVVRALMIVGCPGETPQTVDLNLAALRETPPTTVSLKTFIPLPGCEVWRNPQDFNVEIVNRDMRDYNFWMYTREGVKPPQALILPDGWTETQYTDHIQRMRDGLDALGLMHRG